MSTNGEKSSESSESVEGAELRHLQETLDQYGSFIVRGPTFSVLQPRGPVKHRQLLASRLGCICYAEAHLNSFSKPVKQHAFVIVARNPHPKTETWASAFLSNVHKTFGHQPYGLLKGGRGSGCVSWVKWSIPAMLLEPGFISEAEFARILATGEGADAMGKCLADSITATFESGLVALSIGHAYRGSGDKGAFVKMREDFDPSYDQEAELCESYVIAATEYLTGSAK